MSRPFNIRSDFGFDLDLDAASDWHCQVRIQRNPDDSYDSKAEICRDGKPCCVLVTLNQPTKEAALDKVRLRARDYVHSHGGEAVPAARVEGAA